MLCRSEARCHRLSVCHLFIIYYLLMPRDKMINKKEKRKRKRRTHDKYRNINEIINVVHAWVRAPAQNGARRWWRRKNKKNKKRCLSRLVFFIFFSSSITNLKVNLRPVLEHELVVLAPARFGDVLERVLLAQHFAATQNVDVLGMRQRQLLGQELFQVQNCRSCRRPNVWLVQRLCEGGDQVRQCFLRKMQFFFPSSFFIFFFFFFRQYRDFVVGLIVRVALVHDQTERNLVVCLRRLLSSKQEEEEEQKEQKSKRQQGEIKNVRIGVKIICFNAYNLGSFGGRLGGFLRLGWRRLAL